MDYNPPKPISSLMVSEAVQCKCARCGAAFEVTVPVSNRRARRALTPRYCPTCGPIVEAQEREADDVRTQRERMERLAGAWDALCPPLFRGTDEARLPQAELTKVLAWKSGPKGLLLIGPAGTCKTRCLFVLLKRMLMDKGQPMRYLTATGFADEMMQAFDVSAGAVVYWKKTLKEVPILAIDDLGKGKFTERVETEFYDVLDYRTTHMLPVLATSNMVGKELAGKLSEDRAEPILRRLREFCDVVTFGRKGAQS